MVRRAVAGVVVPITALSKAWIVLLGLALAGCREPEGVPADALRITVDEAGPTALRASDLADAGWPSRDLGRLWLWEAGAPGPRPLDPVQSGLLARERYRFFAGPTQLSHSGQRAYFLTPDDRLPAWLGNRDTTAAAALRDVEWQHPMIVPEDALLLLDGQDSDAVALRAFAEENARFEPTRAGGDGWLWQRLARGESTSLTLDLIDPLDLESRLIAQLWSQTQAPADPDHALAIRVNGQALEPVTWEGAGDQRIELSLPAGLLRDGPNEIEISLPGLEGVRAEISSLDWLAIDYASRPRRADPGFFYASRQPGGVALEVGAAIQQWRIGRSGAVVPLTGSEAVEVAEAEQGWDAAQAWRFFAQEADDYRPAAEIAAARLVPDLRATELGAHWIMLGSPPLLDAAEPLRAQRQSEGLTGRSIPAQAVYDQFGAGTASPEAIRAFLQQAVDRWNPAPRYVLLLGDASYDPQGHTQPRDPNHLPTLFVETVFGGYTASDPELAQLNDDPWPDLAIGRLPAREPEEVERYLEALRRYADSEGAPFRALAVADGQESSFRRDAQGFLDALPAGYEPELLAPAAGDESAADAIQARWREGLSLAAYFGHGSLEQWGKDRLFTVEDAAALEPGEQAPIVLNMTCLTGLFTHPSRSSLAETLLWQPGGPVAVFAPTSLTLALDQQGLAQSIATGLAAEGPGRLGDLVLAAWRSVPAGSQGGRDVMRTFSLFGDPALPIARP